MHRRPILARVARPLPPPEPGALLALQPPAKQMCISDSPRALEHNSVLQQRHNPPATCVVTRVPCEGKTDCHAHTCTHLHGCPAGALAWSQPSKSTSPACDTRAVRSLSSRMQDGRRRPCKRGRGRRPCRCTNAAATCVATRVRAAQSSRTGPAASIGRRPCSASSKLPPCSRTIDYASV
jgi:hypothetical protein